MEDSYLRTEKYSDGFDGMARRLIRFCGSVRALEITSLIPDAKTLPSPGHVSKNAPEGTNELIRQVAVKIFNGTITAQEQKAVDNLLDILQRNAFRRMLKAPSLPEGDSDLSDFDEKGAGSLAAGNPNVPRQDLPRRA